MYTADKYKQDLEKTNVLTSAWVRRGKKRAAW